MKISDHIHSIRIPFTIPLGPGRTLDRFVNVFFIISDRIILIDSGVATAAETILDYVRHIGRTPADISLLILTHAHPDHIGAAARIRKESGCPVAIHEADSAWVEDITRQAAERPIPGFLQLVGGSVKPDRLLSDGDIIDAGGNLTLKVIHTPGHSRGSISLLVQKERALITADAIPLPGGLPIYDDYPASVRSIETLKSIPGIDLLLSSWDVPRKGSEAGKLMEESLLYVRRINGIVSRVAGEREIDAMALCREAAAELGLPPAAATPHLARTFQAHLRAHRSGDGGSR
jgi:glyoxylase-like metal-dependent hydrolase (beta-lactamase superfamily II)